MIHPFMVIFPVLSSPPHLRKASSLRISDSLNVSAVSIEVFRNSSLPSPCTAPIAFDVHWQTLTTIPPAHSQAPMCGEWALHKACTHPFHSSQALNCRHQRTTQVQPTPSSNPTPPPSHLPQNTNILHPSTPTPIIILLTTSGLNTSRRNLSSCNSSNARIVDAG